MTFNTGLGALLFVVATGVAAQSAPPVEQDCRSGQVPHEVYAKGSVAGGDLGSRYHVCVANPGEGIRQFQAMRGEVASDPYITESMRASLLRQIDAKIAHFKAGGR